jgi:hypothetical protein
MNKYTKKTEADTLPIHAYGPDFAMAATLKIKKIPI